MQTVGLACSICADRILMAPEGFGCSRCGFVAHQACAGAHAVCPKCQHDDASATAKEDVQRRRALRQSVEIGRAFFLAIAASLIGLEVWQAVTAGGEAHIGMLGLRMVWTVGLLGAVYTGRAWAAWLLALLQILTSLAAILASLVLTEVLPFFAPAFAGAGILSLAIPALMATPCFRAFLRAQRSPIP